MRVGVDTGGTFTDFVFWDGERIVTRKVRSTPDDPARAIFEGLASADPNELVHGSTVATNSLLERKGARTAFVTTKGFEDILDLARQNRPDLYDWFSSGRPKLVSDDSKFGVDERVLFDGSIQKPLSENAVAELTDAVRGADSVAVCLLHSYANAEHEASIGKALRAAGLFVSLSSEILPEYREYERASTTVVNAYVSPLMASYIDRLSNGLEKTKLRIFQSNGGSISAGEASHQAVRTVLSGPAGGLVGAAAVAQSIGIERFVSFDMGGTSTDVSLYDGKLGYTTEAEPAGFPVRVPMLDIHTVGAGGGSIAFFDDAGALRVGPRSAGASPGPVCYGTGEELTVTDANLLLSRIDPERFLDGAMTLDLDRARRFAGTFDVPERQLAEAIVEAANSNMERAIRAISLERGHDPRDYALISFGGAGALHACDLADRLEMTKVVVPAHAGVLSALGMLVADCVRDYSQSVLTDDPARVFPLLEKRAREDLADQGFEGCTLIRSVDVRYKGQSFELNLPADHVDTFDDYHQRRFGYRHENCPVESVTARVQAIGRLASSDVLDLTAPAEVPSFTSIYVASGWRRSDDAAGNAILTRE
jgi:N-methylhydantoinase A/oxoprolinase/acetone carboxylase beta subunit